MVVQKGPQRLALTAQEWRLDPVVTRHVRLPRFRGAGRQYVRPAFCGQPGFRAPGGRAPLPGAPRSWPFEAVRAVDFGVRRTEGRPNAPA
ncbi:hypothetical protein GCM10027028_12060 [Streptomyces sundarbansensis]